MAVMTPPETATSPVDYQTDPSKYQHWQVQYDGSIATLVMDTKEDGGIRPGYKLKLNSYDLGVDIELHDILQRFRFEHPEVKVVVLTSAKPRVFCSGANIYMLGTSTHAWKVNFCKFTNETRNGIEDSSEHSGLRFIAALTGTTAGGGYELALACDEIILIDDRSSAVSLPEVPLLGVLPGTGGLTRVTDKRHVRRDLADIFCTTPDGVQGQRAKDWGLVDEVVKPQQFQEFVQQRAKDLAKKSDRQDEVRGIPLTPLKRKVDDAGLHYEYVDVAFDRQGRTATFMVRAPKQVTERSTDDILKLGESWWPLQMGRELDDAILWMRTNELEMGLWLLKTEGSIENVIAIDGLLSIHQSYWLVRETIGLLRRTLSRLDVSSRSLFAIIEPSSCFAGTLMELALAADRAYMLLPEDENTNHIALTDMNFGPYAMGNRLSRLSARFYGDQSRLKGFTAMVNEKLTASDALQNGLVTMAPDDIDWEDELRLAIEARAALSPDALTGLESNLRFGVFETLKTRVFGRLSAWQNWIFIRPNAVGEEGALKVYGKGAKAKFNWERV